MTHGIKEDQSDPLVVKRVGQFINPAISRATRPDDGVVIQDVHNPQFFAAWRYISKATGPGARQNEEE